MGIKRKRRKKRVKKVRIILLIIMLLVAILSVYTLNLQKSKNDDATSPVSAEMDTETAPPKDPIDYEKLESMEEEIMSFLGEKESNTGLIYYDLTTGAKFELNEDKVFLAASTVKVQMNMLVYDLYASGKLKLTDTLKYTSEDFAGGTGILQGQDKSKPLEIQMLLDYSIKYSDNIATNMLIRLLGGRPTMRAAINEKFGLNNDISDNFITPEGEFLILKNLYENIDKPGYSHLIEVMKDTVFHDRLDKYIPQNIVAHKIGSYERYIHDVGIIFHERPYILVIFTEGNSSGEEDIAKLSEIIYNLHIN